MTKTKATTAHIQPSPSASPTPIAVKPRKDNIFVSSRASPIVSVESKVLRSVQDPQAVQSAMVLGWLEQLQTAVTTAFRRLGIYSEVLAESQLSVPFRWTIERKVARLASEKDFFEDAVMALAFFLDYSLAEDTYGTVQHDIPRIMNELELTMSTFERFRENPPLEPSDVAAKRIRMETGGPVELIELEELYNTVETGFAMIYQRFEEYVDGIPLTANVQRRCSLYVSQF